MSLNPADKTFLHRRIDELRAEAKRMRRVARSLYGETARMGESAQRMENDAILLDREANLILAVLGEIAKANRGRPVSADVREAALLLAELDSRDRAVLAALRERAVAGICEASAAEIGEATKLAPPSVRRHLQALTAAGFISQAKPRQGGMPCWRMLKDGFGEAALCR